MTKRLRLSPFLSWVIGLIVLMAVVETVLADETSTELLIIANDIVSLGDAQNIDVIILTQKPESARVIVEILDLDKNSTIKLVDERLKLAKGKNYLSSLLNKDLVWTPKSAGSYTIRVTLQSGEQSLITEKTFKVIQRSESDTCTLCALKKQSVSQPTKTAKISSVKVFGESSTKTITIKAIGAKLSFNIGWSIPVCPVGYPCSFGKAIVLPTQDMVIAGSIKNVGDKSVNNIRVVVSLYNSSGKVQELLNKTISKLDPLETRTLVDLNGSDLVWSPKGMKPGYYYFRMFVRYEEPSGLPLVPPTVHERYVNTPSFEVG